MEDERRALQTAVCGLPISCDGRTSGRSLAASRRNCCLFTGQSCPWEDCSPTARVWLSPPLEESPPVGASCYQARQSRPAWQRPAGQLGWERRTVRANERVVVDLNSFTNRFCSKMGRWPDELVALEIFDIEWEAVVLGFVHDALHDGLQVREYVPLAPSSSSTVQSCVMPFLLLQSFF